MFKSNVQYLNKCIFSDLLGVVTSFCTFMISVAFSLAMTKKADDKPGPSRTVLPAMTAG